MPVQHGTTTVNGKQVGFYRWGNSGKKYTYTLGDEAGRKRAKERATRQGRAIHAAGGE